MGKCPKCNTENDDRNYYCKWCKTELKNRNLDGNKRYFERYDYLFNIEIVDYKTCDRDYYLPYRPKKK